MQERQPLVFKFAGEDWEFEAIHRLNYKTFVEEIPQHERSPSQRLVDKFHNENTYLICLCGRELAGMLAVRGNRPFSLDQKLPNLDSYLPPGRRICEVRLLAIEKKYRGTRGGQILAGLLALLWQHGIEKGYDLAIISGTTRQLKLYQHLGFVPFGPVVGSGEAQFQPMYITLETFEVRAREFLRNAPARSFHPSAVNFLPGPVAVRREVRRAFEQSPESHRSPVFMADFHATRRSLCELTGAADCQILVGSGTLANDTVGGQLALEGGRGLVLNNGEFGSRLVDHARRWGLDFEVYEVPWGAPLDLGEVRRRMENLPGLRWVWAVHCETSTGVLNDLDALKALCAEFGLKLCVDCISSLGTVPVDLRGVYLATGASGKGLRSYPGLSMVFHHHPLRPAPDRLPRYLDLGYYAAQDGVPFTFCSNLLHALRVAIRHVDWERRFAQVAELGAELRQRLQEAGFQILAPPAVSTPAVVTLVLPPEISSVELGRRMEENGFLLSYNSEYLRRRNWIQIALMGECAREKVVSVVNVLKRVVFQGTGARRAVPVAE
ncbi:aminotransferase class V-fold PLP-dependent enzyme [Limisphaera ngatamarikiensis]|uniref:Aminotransferase class V-fold PLP-dependent enzyme n=1 Tax=Limisphaera ngatamarikiensis TaxID=1324935 RepID=A0A6M1RPS5_9BACT|nr:aminotransferase class V-fold PLP-dependent enzyme [Limisphaera ngatamarikiensis]NGO38665.1 aminotransferase class V-fold PLP-dependent enzyme [Limisphaera ngatamarikiensis]